MSYNSLGKVLSALKSSALALGHGGGQRQGPHQGGLVHVPWRESPLTRWLKEPLQCARNILLLGTVSPAAEVRGIS
jgi:kinesin family protein 4/21/27